MTDHELATKLKALAETPAPPPRIDLDRARRIGGRRRRARTTALVLGCAAVVAAGGVTAVSLFRPAPPLAIAPAAPAPASTGDLMVAKASFGWLPEQTRTVEDAVGAHGDTTVAVGRGAQPPMIVLSIYDQEPPVPSDLGKRPSRNPVRIAGRDGYWLSGEVNGQGRNYLRWRAPDGRWAQLTEFGLEVPDLRQVLTKVANDVTIADRPVPLPLRITSVPGTFHFTDGYLRRRPDEDGVPWHMMLSYTSDGAAATITVSPPGATVNSTDRPECVTRNGLQGCVTFFRPALGGITAKDLLSRITLLGPDETKWTTKVVG